MVARHPLLRLRPIHISIFSKYAPLQVIDPKCLIHSHFLDKNKGPKISSLHTLFKNMGGYTPKSESQAKPLDPIRSLGPEKPQTPLKSTAGTLPE